MIGAAPAAVGAGVNLAASPYLASLARAVPDRDTIRWWRPRCPPRELRAATAAVGLALGALAGMTAGSSVLLPALVVLAAACTPLVLIDLRQHRLPDRLVLPAGVAGAALLALAAGLDDEWAAWLRAVEAAAVVYGVGVVLLLIAPRALGYGDVKLATVLAGYLGWFGWSRVYQGIVAGFLLACLAAILLLAMGRATQRTPLPFGPCLILGALLVLALPR